MNYQKNIEDYINGSQIDWNKIIDEFTSYINKIINNMTSDFLTQEDKEEILYENLY